MIVWGSEGVGQNLVGLSKVSLVVVLDLDGILGLVNVLLAHLELFNLFLLLDLNGLAHSHGANLGALLVLLIDNLARNVSSVAVASLVALKSSCAFAALFKSWPRQSRSVPSACWLPQSLRVSLHAN